MKKQLATIGSQSDAVIVPKPTKAEVIEALVLAEKNQWEEKKETCEKEEQALKEEIAQWITGHTDNWLIGAINSDSFGVNYLTKELSVSVDIKQDAHVKKLVKKLQDIERLCSFPEHEVRERIKKALYADPRRVKALSESPEIKAMLKTIKSLDTRGSRR